VQGRHWRHPAGPAGRAQGGDDRDADADDEGDGHRPGLDAGGAGHAGGTVIDPEVVRQLLRRHRDPLERLTPASARCSR
jgi:hypothetical protein